MKKRFVAYMLCVSMTMFGLTACGDEKAKVESKETTQITTQSTDSIEASITEEAANDAIVTTQAAGGYVFSYNQVEIEPDADAQAIVDALGEPMSYYEAKSCAFEGLDKIYTYSSFQIETYPAKDKDLISMIILMDDLVTTKEGAYIGMNASEVTKIYGEQDIVDGTLIYSMGNMKLKFVLDNETVVSIEYDSNATDL